jgi:alkylation response protein AidB-like acyl-CoA dehydrogenase
MVTRRVFSFQSQSHVSKNMFSSHKRYQGMPTPYYNESHVAYRKLCRDFVEKELMPHVSDWDEAGALPNDLRKKAYAAGVFGLWPEEFGG